MQRRTFITVINQGFEGQRLFLGGNPKKLRPGIHLNLPVVHQLAKVDMRESSHHIDSMIAFTSDNVPVKLTGSLFYQVLDSYKACYNVSWYKDNIGNIGTSAMRSIIGTFEYDEIIGDRNKINKALCETIGDGIKKWGIECTRFEVQRVEPSNQDIQRQLEQQLEAERARRKQLLDTEAAVNVAEGIKQKTILESEGLLQARKNEAEAHKVLLTLQAEGIRRQVEELSTVVGVDLAMSCLLELKRIEQFKAIAEGSNNSIYFAKDNSLQKGYLADFAESLKHK